MEFYIEKSEIMYILFPARQKVSVAGRSFL